MRRLISFFFIGIAVSPWRVASGQSIYVDMDGGFGGGEVGTGAPSSAFGGAAGVPGYWNQVQAGNGGPWNLRDTNGNLSGVVVTWSGSGGSFGYNNPNISGDYKLLMADADPVGHPGLTDTITGLIPGGYRIFTYACKPQGQAVTSFITVPGSVQGTLAVTGPMPPNQFISGVTHSIHDAQLSGGPLVIQSAEEPSETYVNGFQILAVPEPSLISSFALASAAYLAARRKRM